MASRLHWARSAGSSEHESAATGRPRPVPTPCIPMGVHSMGLARECCVAIPAPTTLDFTSATPFPQRRLVRMEASGAQYGPLACLLSAGQAPLLLV